MGNGHADQYTALLKVLSHIPVPKKAKARKAARTRLSTSSPTRALVPNQSCRWPLLTSAIDNSPMASLLSPDYGAMSISASRKGARIIVDRDHDPNVVPTI